MSTTDHAAAFMEAVKGIPTNFVVTALNQMTMGVNWRGCGKQHIADTYAASFKGKTAIWDNQKLREIDLQKLRTESLNKWTDHKEWKRRRDAAQEETKKLRASERLAREAQLADAARWRKLMHEVDHGRATVTPTRRASICLSEGLAAYIDTITPTPTERTS